MKLLRSFENRSKRPSSLAITYAMASWRSGDAEDCKSRQHRDFSMSVLNITLVWRCLSAFSPTDIIQKF